MCISIRNRVRYLLVVLYRNTIRQSLGSVNTKYIFFSKTGGNSLSISNGGMH